MFTSFITSTIFSCTSLRRSRRTFSNCVMSLRRGKQDRNIRKTHCKLYTVPILFISLYFYNSDEDCTYFTATIIDCNMEVLDNEFMDHHYPSTVLENLKSLWLSKRLCDATLEAGPVKFYVWFKIIYTHICQKYVNLFLFHIFHWKPHLLFQKDLWCPFRQILK